MLWVVWTPNRSFQILVQHKLTFTAMPIPIACAPLDYTSQELLLIGNEVQLPVLLVGGASIHFSRVQEPFLNMGA